MQLHEYSDQMLPAVEQELHSVLDLYRKHAPTSQGHNPQLPELSDMLAYHMGWASHEDAPSTRGKRIRPLLTLLSCEACGSAWQFGLPAAAAVEFVHNFSLIHDDIQDESLYRHGKPAIWKLWGSAQAINAGDLMFTLALASLFRTDRNIPSALSSEAGHILLEACMQLTRGQALDLGYETSDNLTIEDYWMMVSGKTAALLAASAALGGLFAGAPDTVLDHLADFGRLLGMAYQAQDDLLGIWGEPDLTGKSTESDLASRKKTLPVLYGLERDASFKKMWELSASQSVAIIDLSEALEECGAREYAAQTCARLTADAMQALRKSLPENDGRAALEALARQLLGRRT